jgi:nucleotide-binding universal stress UspA family protein
MNSIIRILIPFDFGKVAQSALKFTLNFCADNDQTEILLCYVANSNNYEAKREEMDAFISNGSFPGYVGVHGSVIQGEFVETLLKEQVDFQADMMIMGTKGAKDTSGKALSNSSKMTLEAHCPVLVIPVNYEDFKIEKITLAIGSKKIDDPTVLSTLLVIARQYDAKIHVLTVYEEGDESFYLESQNEAILKYYFEKFYSHNSSTRSSKIAESIMDYDKAHGIDMLAIIPRNHAKRSAPSEGSLTKFLTLKTDIPLLTMNK